jgi:hypothetical protein
MPPLDFGLGLGEGGGEDAGGGQHDSECLESHRILLRLAGFSGVFFSGV